MRRIVCSCNLNTTTTKIRINFCIVQKVVIGINGDAQWKENSGDEILNLSTVRIWPSDSPLIEYKSVVSIPVYLIVCPVVGDIYRYTDHSGN